jgi:hypothetical protein
MTSAVDHVAHLVRINKSLSVRLTVEGCSGIGQDEWRLGLARLLGYLGWGVFALMDRQRPLDHESLVQY